MSTEGYRGRTDGGEAMFAGICVGGWDRGVGEVVVFSMGTRLLTAAEKEKARRDVGLSRHSNLRSGEKLQPRARCRDDSTYLP